jgi:magnesium transporter
MSRRKKNRELNELPTYTGQFNTKTRMKVIQYSLQNFLEKEMTDIEEICSSIKSDCVTWIRVFGMNDSNKIIELIKHFDLNILDAKDILTTQHIMSIEEYDKNIFIVIPVIYYEKDKLKTEQMALIMGKDYLISIQESDFPIFDNIYSAIHNKQYLKYNYRNSDFLLASMLNEIINNYGDEVLRLENELEELEDQLLDVKSVKDDLINSIQEKRRTMINIRKSLFPFKTELAKLLRVDDGLVNTQQTPYFKDIYDQLLYILQNLESCREILSSLIDLYLNNNDLKMNIVMKQLTVVSTIFIPLTFLVGVWGMNFKFMPELELKYGYLIAWGFMLFVGILIWLYMRKKDWF